MDLHETASLCYSDAVVRTLTVLWTLKSDREAISLSNSSVADVAEGFAELENNRPVVLIKPQSNPQKCNLIFIEILKRR